MRKIFTKLFLLATLFFASTNLSAQTYNGGTWYSLYDANGFNLETKITSFNGVQAYRDVFAPVGGNLTFNWQYSGWMAKSHDTYIYESSDGGSNYSGEKGHISGTGSGTGNVSLSANINKIKFDRPTGNTNTVKYTNIKLPLKKHILLADGGYGKEKESKSFGNVTIGNISAVQTVKLRSFLTAGNITITSNNAAFRVGSSSNQGTHVFNVGANACASTNGVSGTPAGGGTLGDINLYDINIYFVPTAAGEYSGTITISDGTSSATISVSGVGVKKTQTIAWAEALSGSDIALPMGKTITQPANAQTEITYSVENDTIISINGNTLTALKAGTTTITATAAETNEWLGATSTITVKVTEKKVQYIHWNDNLTRLKVGGEPVLLTATAWVLIDPKTETQEENSERTPLITYASANKNIVFVSGNVLTIVGEGETTITATLPGDDVYEGVVVSTPVHVRAVSTSVCEAYVLDDSKTRTLNTIASEEYTINGPADKLTFTANRERLLGFSDGNLKVDQYYNGGWHNIFDQKVNLNDYTQYASIPLNRNATKLKFYTESGATGYKNIKDVAVTMATYLETTTPEIVVERSIIGAIIDETIRIQYSNLPDDVPVVNNSDKITVKESGLGNVCGEYGEKELHLTIRPTEIGVIEDVITIHDEATGKKLEIPVTVHTQRNTQTISWEQDLANIHTTDSIALNATAQTDEVYYISSDSTIAYAEGNVLKINKHGQFTLTAVAVESEKYEQATLSKDITINAVQPTVSVWPTVEEPIAYAQPLTTDMLIGGVAEVEGYFDWNTERNQTLVPDTYDLAVRFMPTNTDYYAPVDGTVAVTINKSAQSIVWNDSFENITVADSIALTAYAQTPIEYVLSNVELAYITDNNVLYFTRGGNLQVTAYAIEDDYYLADTCVRELTVLPAYPTIVTYPTASPISYGQKLGESVLSGGEASVSGSFAWADEEALLEAGNYHQTVLFTPDDQVSYKNIEIPVVVLVNPIAQTITWDLTTIEVRQGQSLQLSATASSDLPVTYAVDKTALAKVENNTFYALEVGEVIVTATQDGTYTDEDGGLHANYTAADPVSKTIVIVPQQSPQTIEWNDNLDTIKTTDNITLSAEAETPIHYLSSDSTIAYVEADKLIIKRFGTLTITAVAQQTEDYDQAILEKEVNIVAATPNIIAWPTVQPVTYGTKLNVTMLSGGKADVEGYFDWNTDLAQELVPGTYTLGVRFVPANLNIYATVFDSVEVIVNKAPQTIVWNNNFENILVSDTIVLNASAKTTITYGVSDIDVAALEGNILSFYRGGTINVTAYAEEDAYYLANTLTRELTILPGRPIIFSCPTATAITYGQTLSESILEGGEASTAGSFAWSDSLALPNAGTGWQYVHFVPEDQESFSTVEFQIELVVDQAPQFIEWELTNSVIEVGDTLHLTAVATSGLEVTYTLDKEELAEISGNILIGLQVGMVTITASQSGVYVDEFGEEVANYLEAKPVLQTITIVAKDINTGADMIFNEVQATKVIRDGRLYIIRNGHIYNANGQVIE